MENNKFSEPQRMSRSALPVLFINRLKSDYQELIGFIIILLIANDELSMVQKITYPIAGFAIYLFYVALLTFLDYYFIKFHVSGKNLVVSKGIFRRETLNIPTYKIHSLRTKSGFFYRLFDMKGVAFDTLASKGREVELILDDADWSCLLEMVKDDRDDASTADVTAGENAAAAADCYDADISYSNMALIKGAFCQNHLKGTIILFATLFALLSQIDLAVLEQAAEYTSDHVQLSYSFSSTLVTLAVLYLISLALWLGKVMMRYYDLRLKVSSGRLFFESGLVTRRSMRFTFDKVCSLVVKTNPLEHLLKCSTVTLKQAFNIGDEKDRSEVLIYGCTLNEVLLQWWLGRDYRYSSEIMTLHSGRGLFWYTLKNSLFASVAAAAVLIGIDAARYLWLVAVFVAAYVVIAALSVVRSSIILRDGYIVVNSGSIARRTNYIKYDNVEHIRIRLTPFTPFFHRAHLMLYTSGTVFVVRSLSKDDALAAYDIILNKAHHGKDDVTEG